MLAHANNALVAVEHVASSNSWGFFFFFLKQVSCGPGWPQTN